MNRRDFLAAAPISLAIPQILANSPSTKKPIGPAYQLMGLRAGEMSFELSSLNGPIKPEQTIRIEMVRHYFPFGADNAYIDGHFRNEGKDSRNLQWLKNEHAKLFNHINATCYWTEKWQNSMNMIEEFQGDARWDSFEDTVNWAKAKGIKVKGHPVFWPTPKAIPAWLKRYNFPTQWKMIEAHVRNTVARFSNSIHIWDVVNEMLWEPIPARLDERKWPHIEPIKDIALYISEILKWCREENPGAQFLLNDYGTDGLEKPNLKDATGNEVTDATQRKRYISLVNALREFGQAPSGLGLQSHSGKVHNPESLKAIYDELATANLPLHITEFWINNDQLTNEFMKAQGLPPLEKAQPDDLENARALYVKQVMSLAFIHPKIESFYFWGFWKRAFAKEEKWFSEPLPIYHQVYKLIREEWWSQGTIKINSESQGKFTGFYGDYLLYLIDDSGKPSLGTQFTHSPHHNPFKKLVLG